MTIDLADANLSSGADSHRRREHRLEDLAGKSDDRSADGDPACRGRSARGLLPLFAIGNLSAADTTTIAVYNTFATFVTQLPKSLVAATPALHFVATGTYNRGNNTFTASSIDVVN